MHDGALLIIGVGGIGCRWAKVAHSEIIDSADCLLVDSDSSSFRDYPNASSIHIGPEEVNQGIMPELSSSWASEYAHVFTKMLDRAELVLISSVLGGGVGSGASVWIAEQARSAGALVVTIAGLPFEDQVSRMRWARLSRPRLESASHATIGISLSSLAQRSVNRGIPWQDGGGWISSLVTGLVRTQAKMGVINLDLMDLRTILAQAGRSTVLVGEGMAIDANRIFRSAFDAPLERIDVANAAACLLHIEGGNAVSLGDFDKIAEAFTKGLHDNCNVIYGASIDKEMSGEVRVIAVLSGL
ncbi:MAG: hypothetical protein VXZ89_04565 [Candidatus Thermoplasmatota archaeon]|nr:hypothetical protein [Candidatus Thermoplasmatota archaeon]MEC9173493.1 hypothetical protein [Candidatus Thermoplasmatota archaeon]